MRFRVGTPCSKTWDELAGEGRERYCSDCQKSVHLFEDYSSEELERLWKESGGKLCGRICAESEPEPRSRRAVLAGALLTAISPLMAQDGRVTFHVTDLTKTEVPHAEIKRLDKDGKAHPTLFTDEVGTAKWTDLPLGNTRFQISAPGFASKTITLSVGKKEAVAQVQLEVGSLGEVVVVEPQPSNIRRNLK